ncbi:hypothetical protein [Pseudobacillus wudalianchiensis]|uniref:Uncharacterized protein n=1 Tax=Pseudobacillus wudalianchiensis TaxID=1743143 RepID=A0A1B9B909_9BACI|nr:hypothetical protein [Bacillus wudalianchiensis]OCA92575.1 hypothetical protein A8F95_02445 [Bacillus wudalianchiensis]
MIGKGREIVIKKVLVKTGTYSFIISFLALLIILDRTETSENADGMTSTWEISYADYFFMILQRSIKITFAAIVVAFLIKLFIRNKKGSIML